MMMIKTQSQSKSSTLNLNVYWIIKTSRSKAKEGEQVIECTNHVVMQTSSNSGYASIQKLGCQYYHDKASEVTLTSLLLNPRIPDIDRGKERLFSSRRAQAKLTELLVSIIDLVFRSAVLFSAYQSSVYNTSKFQVMYPNDECI